MNPDFDPATDYVFFDDPLDYFTAMLRDIDRAEKYIFIQTYRFNNDSIGIKFRDALVKKSREGVEIKLLLDSWGTSLPGNFFADVEKNHGEVRHFKKIRFFWDFFTKNHRRNHRKLLLIADTISYIGSWNFTEYSLNWRESVLRANTALTLSFKKIFLGDFRQYYNRYVFEKGNLTRKAKFGSFEIITDEPSMIRQSIRKKFIELVRSANKEIIIQTPYFLPGYVMRKALINAAKLDIDVKVIIPKHSDVGLIDLLRNRYTGFLHRNKVKILYYLPNNLHAKVLMIDRQVFSIGSPNFDYRSFRFQHELILTGDENSIVRQINNHIDETMRNCENFDYEKWLRRPKITKFFEWLLLPFRHLL